TLNSVMTPAVVIRPILPLGLSTLLLSVNHRLPSGPTVMPAGKLLAVVVGNSVRVPPGVIRPILLAVNSGDNRLPSGPTVMAPHKELQLAGNAVKIWAAAGAGAPNTTIAAAANAIRRARVACAPDAISVRPSKRALVMNYSPPSGRRAPLEFPL